MKRILLISFFLLSLLPMNAAEPYWYDRFIKTRYYSGLDIKLHKHLSLTADYVRYQHYDAGKPHQNVVYLTLYVKL
jgi:hypothetical protein